MNDFAEGAGGAEGAGADDQNPNDNENGDEIVAAKKRPWNAGPGITDPHNNDGRSKKRRWNDRSINLILQKFPAYMQKRSNNAPSGQQIKDLVNEYPETFFGRTVAAIKTWMHCQQGKY
ncbi:hypothetical protein TKK_0000324 [Trichogramma kaykai]